jgi:hypothetical protein
VIDSGDAAFTVKFGCTMSKTFTLTFCCCGHYLCTFVDEELAVPDHHNRAVFAAMMKRRREARFYSFDLRCETAKTFASCRCSLGSNSR